MSNCDLYCPDNVFRRFKVVEFPISFVGLSTTRDLDVETDLNASAYLKTVCGGRLMKFDDSQEISASHRAFYINPKDSHSIEITFIPKNECISKAKQNKTFRNRFVFDLRLIKIDGIRCCNNELHSEVGRYYISGQFEDCKICHSPDIVNFGDVIINTKVTKYVRLHNESNVMSAKMKYVRVPGFVVTPETLTVLPNTSKKVSITIKPTCLKLKNTITFKIKNPHDDFIDTICNDNVKEDTNFLTYVVHFKLNVIYRKSSKELKIESLHMLNEQSRNYTYTGNEVEIQNKRKETALNFLQLSKTLYAKKTVFEKYTTGKVRCYSNLMLKKDKPSTNFCQPVQEKASIYDLFDIMFMPFMINFGRVGVLTQGEKIISIKNNTKYYLYFEFLKHKYITYTEDKIATFQIKLKPFSDIKITIFCHASREGIYTGTFSYIIDKKYYRTHPYTLHVGTPTLMAHEKNLKFGMVTTESFVTSVPLRIYNHFNLGVDFKWEEINPDTPFEIKPNCGTVPSHCCRICDVQYICKASKTKTHEVDLLSIGDSIRAIPFELSIITRKLSIKFLQPAVIFKDIPLNLETVEIVKLENSSREIALFHVVEPLIPGFKIEPMFGTLRPKMVMSFAIVVKIPCTIEFAFDIFVKINNKENVSLPVSGNVVEPKIIIHPKNVFMTRVPCNMITFVPVTFQNISTLRTTVEVLNTGDDNIFNVYILQGNERKRIFEFNVEGGQSKTVFIKVYDIFRREYEMYIPFKVNGLLGPPNNDASSTELRYYIEENEKNYENNAKLKIKTVYKDICYCRVVGVITVPWIHFSVEKFYLDYKPNKSNSIKFTMTNISKYYLYVTIMTAKLSPNFTLELRTDEPAIINETHIKIELDRSREVHLKLTFHPKGYGKFVSVALLYLDKHMTTPYYNLTFYGKRQVPIITPSMHRIIFPPCNINENVSRNITLKMEGESEKDFFFCNSKEEPNLRVEILDSETILEDDSYFTLVTVEMSVCCTTTYARNITLKFEHDSGSSCEVEVSFCVTFCPLTLHTQFLVKPDENPYPYYPKSSQSAFYNYLETCLIFLEKWMFQQGFRRDLYPVIPDTFHSISTAMSSQSGGTKSKGINVSYLSFVRRIAGPLMKHIRKISVVGVDELFKTVKEIHDTYREIIGLLRSRGANLWALQAKFLLSHDQFTIYSENATPKGNADIIITRELLADVDLYNRLNKQSWIDFILQSYKVFVMDSCFFKCVCVSSQPRDVIKVLIDWYNENIRGQHQKLRGTFKPLRTIRNITTDLIDGIAIISSILTYCPFMQDHFQLFSEVDKNNTEGGVINNACLIIEAMNLLRLYFPLNSNDFLEPNYLLMLFLSIHLYVTLPMYKPKDRVEFSPPLLRSSSRQVAICPTTQESLIFNYIVLNNTKNCFTVEKASPADNGKKMCLSIKYVANFVETETAILLVHGYNKTRIFDTYVVFLLNGCIGSLNPVRKCKVTGPLYRPNKVDVLVSSPFMATTSYKIYLTDNEPSIPVQFEDSNVSQFCVRRLNLIDTEITLSGLPKESGQEVQEHKLYLQIICLNTQVGNSWIWFRSDIGEFYVRVSTQPRWDLAIDTLQAKVHSWPMDPCSCGEACECYRTTALMIPHRNDLMLKSLRYALLEHASEVMINVYDQLIESATGKIILGMLLEEGGTNLSEVQHILRSDTTFRITSRALLPRIDKVTVAQHTGGFFVLPVTVPGQDKAEKYSVTLTSECGMDIRTYRILFIESFCE